ncbi:MAG: hypothetical protein ACQESR_12705 [Planctomycetota bacterium]
MVHVCLVATSGYLHSPVRNELCHLVSGLSHWDLSIAVINVGYGFEGSFTMLKDYRFQSAYLAGNHPSGEDNSVAGNRFEGGLAGMLRVPFPRNFVQGIDTQKLDFERRCIMSYVNGRWQRGGWWWFYAYALLLKTPVGALILCIMACLVYVARVVQANARFEEAFLIVPVALILCVASWQIGFTVHTRYVIPVLPFIFVWSGQSALLSTFGCRRTPGLALLCVVLASLESVWIFPHSQSFFNSLAGGPRRGHEYPLDSNIAWGQDLYYLREWLDDHPEATPFALACITWIDPALIGIHSDLPPAGPKSVSASCECNRCSKTGPLPGWYGIDVNFLQGSREGTPNKNGDWVSPADECCDLTYFQRFRHVAVAGYSVYIYHITPRDANRVRRELGLPELPEDWQHEQEPTTLDDNAEFRGIIRRQEAPIFSRLNKVSIVDQW